MSAVGPGRSARTLRPRPERLDPSNTNISTPLRGGGDSPRSFPTATTASQRAYDVLEIRLAIFRWVDKGTLAGLARLHKAGTAGVAAVLYEEVHISQMSKMSRANARRATYCNSVRRLDRSPLPTVALPWSRKVNTSPRFDSERLLSDLIAYQKKFPNLQTVLFRYPTPQKWDHSTHEHPYIAHLLHDKVVVELQTEVELDMYARPFPFPPPKLPPAPVYTGMEIRHTMVIKLPSGDFLWRYDDPVGWQEHLARWKQFLYHDSVADKRIVGIEYHICNADMQLSVEEGLAYLTRRNKLGCGPLSTYIIEQIHSVTPSQLRCLSAGLGAGLRKLQITEVLQEGERDPTAENFPDLQSVIAILDEGCPDLEFLFVEWFYWRDTALLSNYTPLSGMPNLRTFVFMHGTIEPQPELDSVEDIARYVWRLGSRNCVYEVLWGGSKRDRNELTVLVKQMKRAAAISEG